jgi:hypothetical protein
VLLAVIIYVATNKGTIKIEVDDPSAVIKVDGESVRIEVLGEGISLRPGKHKLEVTWGDRRLQTNDFEVLRGENKPLHIEYAPKPDGRAITSTRGDERPAGAPVNDERATSDGASRAAPPTVVAPPPNEPAPGPQGKDVAFRPLFNGKDLSGLDETYKNLDKLKGLLKFSDEWASCEVAGGILIVRGRENGSPAAHLFHLSPRALDLTNFHLRARAMIPVGNRASLIIRGAVLPISPVARVWKGYAIAINGQGGAVAGPKTGSIANFVNLKPDKTLAAANEELVVPGRWFTLDVIAEGNRFVVSVNGQSVVDWTDSAGLYPDAGRIILRSSPTGEIRFQEIEVKDLSSGVTGGSSTSAATTPAQAPVDEPPVPPAGSRSILPVAILSGTWRVEGNELVQSGGGGTILLGDTPLSSYDLRFEGQIVSGNEGFNALFHRTSGDHVRFFHVGELGGKRVDLGFLYEGKEGGQSRPIRTVKGRWYDILVKVRGAEYWCSLDRQEVFHDVDERFLKGRIGLATISVLRRLKGKFFGAACRSCQENKGTVGVLTLRRLHRVGAAYIL